MRTTTPAFSVDYGARRIVKLHCRLVPFVEDEHTVFLKTIIPSRKATKQYLGEESDDHER
jgi:hypothetical protein